MLTGQPPVQGTSFYSMLKAHMGGNPRPVTEFAPDVPQQLAHILAKSLEKLPEARFQSAEEFSGALGGLALTSRSGSAERFTPDGHGAEHPAVKTPMPRATAPTPTPTPTPRTPQTSTASRSWDPAVLESARKNLAVFVGPMAKILVNRAAKNAQSVTELYRLLASEITAASDRERFLRSRPL